MVYNALAATAAGYAHGMTDSEIAQGLKANVPIAGRNNLIEGAHYTVIDDCYNENPASMKSSLDVLAYADTRTVAVLGDMFELGADEKKMHYDVGVHAAEKGINVLLCIGNLSVKSPAELRRLYIAQRMKMKHRPAAWKYTIIRQRPNSLRMPTACSEKATPSS